MKLILIIMSAGLALGCATFGSIHTKADVMKFAIEMSTCHKENGSCHVNLKKAKKIYDFFCSNVELVDSDVISTNEFVGSIGEQIRGVIKEAKEEKGS